LPHTNRDRPGLTSVIIVIAVTALAVALRVYRLGYWSLEGDEIYTLRDSLTTVWLSGSRPLLFFLNHHLIVPWTHLDELGLRILPALFGIAAVPVVYVLTRRTVGVRAGVLAAVLVALHPWHLNWSQFARYYTLVFLLSAIFPLAFYVGLQEQRWRWVIAGVVSGVLALLAHPSSGLVVAGVGLWIVATVGRRFLRGDAEFGKMGWPIGLLVTSFVAVIAFRLVPQFWSWVVLNLNHRWGHVGVVLLLSYVDWLSITLACFAAAGLLWLWRDGDRSLVLLHLCVLGVPLGFLAIISPWVSVSTGYLIAAAPSVVIGAAIFLDRVMGYGSDPAKSRLVGVTCLVALLTSQGPRIVSQYRDGGRLDFRAAALHIKDHAAVGDVVLSDQPRMLRHYLPTTTIDQLEPVVESLLAGVRRVPPGGALWIVSATVRRGGFRELNLGSAQTWVRTTCRLSETYTVPRLDYKHNELRVYRCPSAELAAAGR
jgi:hypothetical protein